MLSNALTSSGGETQPVAKQPFDGATILMIDDEKLNSYVVAEYLKADGYRDLIHTTDPMNALSLAARVRPDVILLDIEMPRLNGLELLRRVRADHSLAETHVIVLSATDDEEIRSQAFELNAAAFLQKPIRKEELLTLLRKILVQGSATRVIAAT